MVFDKTKLMRNAERYLAQGKIQSAITEYKQVVEHDPKDFGTLNTLGDLYTKTLDRQQAVACYTTVAEHFSKQGFAHKAIAIYNKISKLQPDSIEIFHKLADLYKFKGSVNEARSHYQTVVEHYEKKGRTMDALEVREQIASLDPNDTAAYPVLAAAYLSEGQTEEAAEAFAEAGARFAKRSEHGDAINAFEKALEVRPTDQKFLAGFAQSHFALGTAADAAERLKALLESEPHSREIALLLVDCLLEAGDLADAEKAIISTVEKEPSNYPKLLDLARLYLKAGDAASTARVMAITAEHLLLEGQVDEFQTLVDEILNLDADQLEGLRLRARLAAWQRDETGMRDALATLAAVAKQKGSIDDERYALAQLVMIVPQETDYADRLREINQEFGFDDAFSAENLFDEQFLKARPAEPELETFAIVGEDGVETDEIPDEPAAQLHDFAVIDDGAEFKGDEPARSGPETDDDRLARDVDSIKFYIDSGYLELAEKAIGELRAEFGDRPEIEALLDHLQSRAEADGSDETGLDPGVPVNDTPLASGFGIEDLRSELGIDEAIANDDADYDTHYHTAVAYQEMGLLDEAVREFQEAAALVRPNDPQRRFFHCSVLLGHCFMQKAMPNLALKWYQRALETSDLTDDEKQGVWYELASAYEAEGDLENAGRYFEQVYAENIDFRDVGERVRNLVVQR